MMRAIGFVSLLATVVGCSATSGSDDLPPTLEITSPERGTVSEGDQVTVTGRVQDDGKAVTVTINGTEVIPSADGSFTTTLALGHGISTIETHAIDSAGHDVRDVRAVLAGTLAPSDGTVAAPIGARIGPDAFRSIGGAIATTVEAVDFTAAAQALNPVYNNTGCLGAKIDITSVGLDNIGIDLVPGAGALATGVAIDNVVVRLKANFKVACVGGSTNITVRSSRARINGNLAVAATGGNLSTSLPSVSVALDGFSVDVGGVPGAIESLLKGEARKAAEKALTSMIREQVPPLANDALAGLLARPYTAGILGHDTRVMITPSEVALTADGLFVAVDTKLAVTGGEGGVFASAAAPLSASLMPSNGLGIAIADDALNQLFSGLWAAGALEQSVSLDSIAVLGALLDDDARSLAVSLSLPPTVTSDAGNLGLAVGDLMVSVRDASDVEIQRLALSLSTTLAAGPTQTGKITLTVGTPTIKAQVLAQSDAVERPLTDEQVEGIVTGAWGLVGGLADEALANVPMPAVGGVTMGAPSIAGAGGYVIADVPLQ